MFVFSVLVHALIDIYHMGIFSSEDEDMEKALQGNHAKQLQMKEKRKHKDLQKVSGRATDSPGQDDFEKEMQAELKAEISSAMKKNNGNPGEKFSSSHKV